MWYWRLNEDGSVGSIDVLKLWKFNYNVYCKWIVFKPLSHHFSFSPFYIICSHLPHILHSFLTSLSHKKNEPPHQPPPTTAATACGQQTPTSLVHLSSLSPPFLWATPILLLPYFFVISLFCVINFIFSSWIWVKLLVLLWVRIKIMIQACFNLGFDLGVKIIVNWTWMS